MAPVGMVDMLGGFATPEVGIISVVVFLIISVTLLALCAKCNRNTNNAYDVSDKIDGAGASTDTGTSTWRDHKNMPANTLERSMKS